MHEVRQHRAALLGVDAVSLKSVRHFPRHSHDQFGIGVIHAGGHRSWSDIGWVEASAGISSWSIPGRCLTEAVLIKSLVAGRCFTLSRRSLPKYSVEDQFTTLRTLRPAVRDRNQARRFERLFNALTEPHWDSLHIDEEFVMTLGYAFRNHSSHRPLRLAALPGVRQIVKLIDREPEKPLSLQAMADMAGVSGFHLLRGSSCATGATPHFYILQRRVRLARQLLAAGEELPRGPRRPYTRLPQRRGR